MVDFIRAHYVVASRYDLDEVAHRLAVEQSTSGWPCSSGGHDSLSDIHGARVEQVIPLGPAEGCLDHATYIETARFGSPGALRAASVVIGFPAHNIDGSITNILNLVAGETHHLGCVSSVRLVNLELPAQADLRLKGPAIGISGLRLMLGVGKRPLLVAPIKPQVGISEEVAARLAGEAWLGGADIVKDDELYCDAPYVHFSKRMSAIGEARRRVEDKVGARKLYIANVMSDWPRCTELIECAQAAGADGVMVAPALMGYGMVRHLREQAKLIVCCHNAFQSPMSRLDMFGIAPRVLVSLQRLAGADIIIEPGPWDSFVMSPADHLLNVDAATEHAAGLSIPAALLALSGGKNVLSIQRLWEAAPTRNYGLVVGDALYNHPGGPQSGARAIVAVLESVGSPRTVADLAQESHEIAVALERVSKRPTSPS